MKYRSIIFKVVTALIFMAAAFELHAQRFSVASFRMLPNDVSAFINPVRDLNDEDCGLVKVIGTDEFAFSTPLGIVKRVDNVGEIWLYLPRGSRKITIKHPEWGVIRDYSFPDRIESHVSYELRINEPMTSTASNIMQTAPIVQTVRDTLVVTRVDTLVIRPIKKKVPFTFGAQATMGYGGKSRTLLGGVMLMAMKQHGGFVHVATDFGKVGSTQGECGKHGEINGYIPFYSGRTRHSTFMVNAGGAHRISNYVAIFEGIGYARSITSWELAPSEGGGYVRNSHYSSKGVSFEIGTLLTLNRLSISASVASIKGYDWYGSVGIGIRLGK